MALLLTAWPLRDVSAALIALVFPLVHAAVTCAVDLEHLARLVAGEPPAVPAPAWAMTTAGVSAMSRIEEQPEPGDPGKQGG